MEIRREGRKGRNEAWLGGRVNGERDRRGGIKKGRKEERTKKKEREREREDDNKNER